MAKYINMVTENLFHNYYLGKLMMFRLQNAFMINVIIKEIQ